MKKEITLEENIVFQGKILTVRKDKVLSAKGEEVEREIVIHPGGVGIALEDEEGKFYLVKQYRYGHSDFTLEYPAGKREKNEDSLETAKREIIEETGYEGIDFIYLGNILPTPAYDSEVVDFFYAKEGSFIGQNLDQDEDVDIIKLSLEEIEEKILNGEITDAKTIAMTYLIQKKIKK